MVVANTEEIELRLTDADGERQPVPYNGGMLVPLSGKWPRTDLHALPLSLRSLHDCDADGVADVVITTKVRLIDLNNDGLVCRQFDALLLKPVDAEAIQADAVLHCGAGEREAAIRRAVAGL